jgi:putative ABC transport system permease protein
MSASKIAHKNLFEDKVRFVVAQAGILFAVSLVTIQLGVLRGFARSTTSLIDYSKADLWVAHDDMSHLEQTSFLPAQYLQQAAQVSGVAQAEVLVMGGGRWRDSQGRLALSNVRIWGFNPEGSLLAGWPLTQGQLSDLNRPYTVILDFAGLKSLNLSHVGDQGTIGGLPAQVVGLTRNTQSISSGPFVFASLETANAYNLAEYTKNVTCKRQADGTLDCRNEGALKTDQVSAKPAPPPRRLNLGDPISYILIKARPGTDLDDLKRRLEEALPNTSVYTTQAMSQRTRSYWQQRTSIGFILGLGATVGFIVGMVIVGQILYSSVADHIREFGTLKAMGASNWVIYRVIIEQSLWMAVLGYIPSIFLCLGLSFWAQSAQGVIILIEPATAAGVFLLTIVMCVGAAIVAVQKVTRVDPAIVFKA